MTDKQLLNSVENCVNESFLGYSKLHSNLLIDFTKRIVLDVNSCAEGKVALISGGGSGHEPFPAGYVGKGMLTASVSGSIFTSPPFIQILHSIRLVATKCSCVLLLIPNYTGDVLNFGLAMETAMGERIKVESVVIGEDVTQELRKPFSKAGKRGMCGLVLVFKIAGYVAQIGHDLDTVKMLTLEAVRSMASMGLCVSACCKPGIGLLFHLDKDEMEVGVGVHGEAGVARVKMLTAEEAVKMLLDFLIPSLNADEGDEVVALLNNLGSLSYLEMWLLAGELDKQLLKKKIKIARLYAGCFFSSLNMAGVQICLLKLNRRTKKTFLEALDHPTLASAWPKPTYYTVDPKNLSPESFEVEKVYTASEGSCCLPSEESEFLRICFLKISDTLMKDETYLNQLDSACGDGDCGTTFRHLAILLKEVAEKHDFSFPANLFFELSLLVGRSIGGTTGALYGLFFKGCSKVLETIDDFSKTTVISKCWRAGVDTIKKYSFARIGDRTMLDALEVSCQEFENQLENKSAELGEAFRRAVKAAKQGCGNTKFMEAFAGRASYTDQSQQKDIDPGAYAVTVWLSAIECVMDERELERAG